MATRDVGNDSMHDDGDGSGEEMDDETDECEYSVETNNGFDALSRGPEGEWTGVHRKKRKRFSTGSVDENAFQQMTTDDKLSVIFSKLISIEQKQSGLEIMKTAIKTNEQTINSVRQLQFRHDKITQL